MTRLLRNPRLLAAAGFVFLLLLVALWPETTPVDVATVVQGPFRLTVDEEGETRVRERFVVTSPAAGRLLRVELEPGDAVIRGETLLATIRPVPLDVRTRAEATAALDAAEASVGRARAERERADAALRLARSELGRQQALFREEIASRQALESQEIAVRTAEEALRAATFATRAAEYERDMARARLNPAAITSVDGSAGTRAIEIRSPIDGVVLKRHRESEGVVAAGETLLELGDARDIEIVSDLLSTDAVRVKAGDPVVVEQWGGETPLQGRVRRVEPSGFMKISALGVEEQRVNVVVDLEEAPPARAALGDGYRVEIRIIVVQVADALKIPTSALFRRGEKWAVFVMDGGRARLREIEIGHRNGLEAEVRSGLQAGAQVIVHPSDTLADGARVAKREA